MKKVLSILVTTLLIACVFAQSPQKMSYQAVIRNSSNALITNTTIGIQISILKGSASGTVVYVETQTPTTNDNGLFSIEIGVGAVVSGDFSTINWADGTYFVKTETDPDGEIGGILYTITDTNQLLSVPYALFAANAGAVNSGGNFIHYIGEQYGGGVIFHLWKDIDGVEHGLIVSTTDLSEKHLWGYNPNNTIYIHTASTWDGYENSTLMTNYNQYDSAARLCRFATIEGLNDWYLPAIDELKHLWQNRFIVNKCLSNIIDSKQIFHNNYWSSTQFGSSHAIYLNFLSGDVNYSEINNEYYVRAIRKF